MIGVKVWVFHGEVYKRDIKEDAGVLVRKKKKKPVIKEICRNA